MLALERCWDTYSELRSRRRWRAWFRLNHLRYWSFVRARAQLINEAAARSAEPDSGAKPTEPSVVAGNAQPA